jgi:3-methylfumaryl-CoA hydratase
MDEAQYQEWIGRSETVTDEAAEGPLMRLAALLDHAQSPWAKDAVPPLAHWLYFLSHARQSQLDEDGHPRRGGLLPAVPLPRRMWAGGRLEWRNPIPVGAALSRRSTLTSIKPKTGKSGSMVFVTVLHEIFADGILAVKEEQDIVYRDRPLAIAPAPAPKAANSAPPPAEAGLPAATHTSIIHPDPVLLFRFSALTFNSHRIHYDRDYARDVEAYQGLVVHGPLIATLLMDHFLRHHPSRRVTKFSFRAQSPLFDGAAFTLNSAPTATGAQLWAANQGMPAAMQADIEFI